MPIKFRCQQCRQFLGISRAQAGEIVDCPTCGRTIRVPELDGTVKPLAARGHKLDEPSQNSDDSSRPARPRKDQSAEPLSSGEPESPPRQSSKRAGAVTLDEPEAIELPPLPAPEEVAPGPLPTRDIDYGPAADDEAFSEDSLDEDRPWRSTAQPRDSWKQLIAAAALKEQEVEAASRGTSEEESENIDDDRQPETLRQDVRDNSDQPAPVRQSDRDLASLGFSTQFAVAGLIALICSAGFWIGRSTAITWGVDREDAGKSATQSSVARTSASDLASVSGIDGRITWKPKAGQWQADRDACVIVLPVKRAGVSLVSIDGLQPNDSGEDREILRSSLQAMGGAVAFADNSGHFQIALNAPGDFHVLILSRSVGHSASSTDEETSKILSKYFDRAESMLGEQAYRLETIVIPEGSVIPLDTAFEQQD